MDDKLRAFTQIYTPIATRLLTGGELKSLDKSCKTRALWDTGANTSCISHDVVSKLELVAIGKRMIRTPSGEKEVDTYLVDIELPNNVSVPDIEVCETEIGNQDIDLLIGMDIISRGDFAITNNGGKTTFSFSIPSMETINFVNKINAHNKVGKLHGMKNKKK